MKPASRTFNLAPLPGNSFTHMAKGLNTTNHQRPQHENGFWEHRQTARLGPITPRLQVVVVDVMGASIAAR